MIDDQRAHLKRLRQSALTSPPVMTTSWANASPIARLISAEELSKAAQDDLGGFSSPVLKLRADSRRHFDGVAIPITNERWKERWKSMCVIQSGNILDGLEEDEEERTERERELEARAERWRASPSFMREECNLTGLDEAEKTIGIASDWLELDSPDDWLRHDCEIALKQELAYAAYLGLSSVVLPPPLERVHVASYGRALRACLETSYMQLAVRLPLYHPAVLTSTRGTATPVPSSPAYPSLPGLSPKFLTGPVSPSNDGTRRKGGTIKPSMTELNAMWEAWDTMRTICGYNPRLTLALDLALPLPSTQEVLARWAAEPVSHIFLPASTFISNAKGYPVLPKGTQTFLQATMKNRPTIILVGASAHLHPRGTEDKYVDYIRYLEISAPHTRRMQEANTLENHAQGYQDFLQMSLQPLQDYLASMVYENFERDPVKYQKYEEAVFKALSDRPADVRIVLAIAGAGRGPLVARSLKAAERSARNVSIYAIEKNPSAYVTLQQRQQTEWNDRVTVLFGDMRYLEVPEKADIIVSELLGSFGDNELSPECLDGAMRFLKGLPLTNSHNGRSAFLNFVIPHAGVLHGFAGYFEAVLYDSIGLSIHPDRKDAISKDMLSWFPCFFPVKEPLYLPSNSELRVYLWRLTGANKVWYEWYAEALLPVSFQPTVPSALPSPFLPRPQSSGSGSAAPPGSPRVNGAVGGPGSRSPLVDAMDLSFGSECTSSPESQGEPTGLMKIGQTSLHNPGGRSSCGRLTARRQPNVYKLSPPVLVFLTPASLIPQHTHVFPTTRCPNRHNMKYFTFFTVLVAAAAQASASLTINTPPSIVQCEPVLLQWSDGTPPYFPSILPGGQTSGTLESLPTTSSTSYTWDCNIAAGTSITLALRDSTGAQVYSDAVTIAGSSDSSCVGSSASGSSSNASGSTTASESSSSGETGTTDSSTGRSTGAGSPSTLSPSSSVDQPKAASTSGGASATSSSSSSSSNAVTRVSSVNALSLAVMLGAVGAVLLTSTLYLPERHPLFFNVEYACYAYNIVDSAILDGGRQTARCKSLCSVSNALTKNLWAYLSATPFFPPANQQKETQKSALSTTDSHMTEAAVAPVLAEPLGSLDFDEKMASSDASLIEHASNVTRVVGVDSDIGIDADGVENADANADTDVDVSVKKERESRAHLENEHAEKGAEDIVAEPEVSTDAASATGDLATPASNEDVPAPATADEAGEATDVEESKEADKQIVAAADVGPQAILNANIDLSPDTMPAEPELATEDIVQHVIPTPAETVSPDEVTMEENMVTEVPGATTEKEEAPQTDAVIEAPVLSEPEPAEPVQEKIVSEEPATTLIEAEKAEEAIEESVVALADTRLEAEEPSVNKEPTTTEEDVEAEVSIELQEPVQSAQPAEVLEAEAASSEPIQEPSVEVEVESQVAETTPVHASEIKEVIGPTEDDKEDIAVTQSEEASVIVHAQANEEVEVDQSSVAEIERTIEGTENNVPEVDETEAENAAETDDEDEDRLVPTQSELESIDSIPMESLETPSGAISVVDDEESPTHVAIFEGVEEMTAAEPVTPVLDSATVPDCLVETIAKALDEVKDAEIPEVVASEEPEKVADIPSDIDTSAIALTPVETVDEPSEILASEDGEAATEGTALVEAEDPVEMVESASIDTAKEEGVVEFLMAAGADTEPSDVPTEEEVIPAVASMPEQFAVNSPVAEEEVFVETSELEQVLNGSLTAAVETDEALPANEKIVDDAVLVDESVVTATEKVQPAGTAEDEIEHVAEPREDVNEGHVDAAPPSTLELEHLVSDMIKAAAPASLVSEEAVSHVDEFDIDAESAAEADLLANEAPSEEVPAVSEEAISNVQIEMPTPSSKTFSFDEESDVDPNTPLEEKIAEATGIPTEQVADLPALSKAADSTPGNVVPNISEEEATTPTEGQTLVHNDEEQESDPVVEKREPVKSVDIVVDEEHLVEAQEEVFGSPANLSVNTNVADVPERPKSPWTPSYSVTMQGQGTPSQHEEVEEDTVLGSEEIVAREPIQQDQTDTTLKDIVPGHAEIEDQQQTADNILVTPSEGDIAVDSHDPVEAASVVERPKSPYPPSYSVTQMGSGLSENTDVISDEVSEPVLLEADAPDNSLELQLDDSSLETTSSIGTPESVDGEVSGASSNISEAPESPRSNLGIITPGFDTRSEVSDASHEPVAPSTPRSEPDATSDVGMQTPVVVASRLKTAERALPTDALIAPLLHTPLVSAVKDTMEGELEEAANNTLDGTALDTEAITSTFVGDTDLHESAIKSWAQETEAQTTSQTGFNLPEPKLSPSEAVKSDSLSLDADFSETSVLSDGSPGRNTSIISLSDLDTIRNGSTEGGPLEDMQEILTSVSELAIPQLDIMTAGVHPIAVTTTFSKDSAYTQASNFTSASEQTGTDVTTPDVEMLTMPKMQFDAEGSELGSIEPLDEETVTHLSGERYSPGESAGHTPVSFDGGNRPMSITHTLAMKAFPSAFTSHSDQPAEVEQSRYDLLLKVGPTSISADLHLHSRMLSMSNDQDTMDQLSLPSSRRRLESTTSSLYFPGGWVASPIKERPSLEVATGVFSRPLLETASAPVPPEIPESTPEEEKKWRCAIM
ncbi:hypothetical protein EW145_g1417 [Phellinidium pouzarii]|uniref:Protein arginine N-methyltransferase n=1 Tax=Phellinidium pouzarii TaxID=167371 RepID=A0A4S4LEK7_9AGAM|nr:hypothetical protein EW145_g1417 [Phellinidium pouzarii]